MILLRSTFPRYRYDQLMLLCWTSIFPSEWLYFYVCYFIFIKFLHSALTLLFIHSLLHSHSTIEMKWRMKFISIEWEEWVIAVAMFSFILHYNSIYFYLHSFFSINCGNEQSEWRGKQLIEKRMDELHSAMKWTISSINFFGKWEKKLIGMKWVNNPRSGMEWEKLMKNESIEWTPVIARYTIHFLQSFFLHQ